MTTPLGPGTGSGFHLTVYNDDSVTIDEGEVAALKGNPTTTYLQDSIQEQVLAVEKYDGGNGKGLGVALSPIAAGELGQVCVIGMVRCKAAAAVAQNTGIEVVAASARLDDTAGNAPDVGHSLEAAAAAGDLFWAFVNFVSDAVPGT